MVQFDSNAAADLDRIRLATESLTGLRYMQTLARALTEVLGVCYAFVAERSPGDRELAQTVALAYRHGAVGDLVYPLFGTPCNDVIEGGSAGIACGAAAQYPADRALAEMAVEAYAGMLLAANGGTSCGWLGVMDTKPRRDIARLEAVLRGLGARTSIELARMRVARRMLRDRDAASREMPAPLP